MPVPSTAFVDRDGVINHKAEDGCYVKSWSEFAFLPGAIDGLRILRRAGCRVVIVTNQRGVALGRMSAAAVDDIHDRMRAVLAPAGADVHAVYVCPHEKGTCGCRKPDVGLFLQARRDDPKIDFEASVVIGDALSDLEAGRRLGIPGVLIAGEREVETRLADARARRLPIAAVAASLREAALRLVGEER